MLSHVRKGDVVFTADAHGTAMHNVISTAQVFGNSPGHQSSVHAAIASGNGAEVYESVGSGLRRQQLHAGDYRIYCYRGPRQDEIRNLVVMMAEDFLAEAQQGGGFGAYQTRKATFSVFRSANRGANGHNRHNQQFGQGAKARKKFFCSNLVFRCYAAASEAAGMAELPIPDSHAQLSPRDLEGLLMGSNWWHARSGGQAMHHP